MKKRLILFAIFVWFSCVNVIYANEAETGLVIESTITGEAVSEELDSVLQIVVMYETKEKEMIPIQGGCGFLIGTDDSSLQMVITSKEVITVSDDVKEMIREQYATESSGEITFQIKVVVDKDVMVDAGISASSNEKGYVVLHLNQDFHDRHALYIYDKSAENCLRQDAYVVGYPSAVKYGEPSYYHTKSQAVMVQGFMESEEEIEGTKYFKHHIFPGYGNIGGPIVDSENHIIALNLGKNDGKNFYALEIREITPVLDSLGIPYKKITELEAEQQREMDALVHKEELQAAVSEAESVLTEEFTKKTVLVYQAAVEEAKTVLLDEDAIQAEVDEQETKLETAKSQLKYKPDFRILAAIIVGSVLICIMIFMMIMILTKEKRRKRKEEKKAAFTITEPAPVFSDHIQTDYDSYKELVDAGNGAVTSQKIWNIPESRINMTSVLNASLNLNKENTGVQSVKSKKHTVMLLSADQSERVVIDKSTFTIGKDRALVDYEIKNNPVVSRVHALIVEENGRYYLLDQSATNGTFVNSRKLLPGAKWELHNHDMIVIANAKYEFICM